MASDRWLRWLCWSLVVLAIVSAAVTLLSIFGNLYPPHFDEDFVDRLIADRTSDQAAYPFVLIGSLATFGVYVIACILGLVLRTWARPSPMRDVMTVLLVLGGTVGVVSQLINIGVGAEANPFYCDCGYRTEEVIGGFKALQVGWTIVSWLAVGATTLVGIGVGVTGRVIEVSPAWRLLSSVIAIALLVAVLIRVVGSFVFIEAFDPFQISDLIVAATAGVLVPIWAILLARGARMPAPETAAS